MPQPTTYKMSDILDGDTNRRRTPSQKRKLVALLPQLEREVLKDYVPNEAAEAVKAEKAVKSDDAEIPFFLWDDRQDLYARPSN